MNTGDTAWVLISAALVLFMTVGLAFFYGGLDAERNVLHMLAMNFFTIAVVTLVWVLVGFSLAFGPDAGHGIIGNLHYAGLSNMSGVWPGTHIPKLTFMAFQLTFAIITPALITGAVAGRIKFEAWIAFCLGWSLIAYPLIAHWIFDPQGWIYRLGGRDFAGGAVVHASAGAAALVLLLILGPRTSTSPASRTPHSIPMVAIGAGILWFGWFGFNAGSALGADPLAAVAFTNTQLAAAAGFLVWALLERLTTGRVTVVGVATGAVAGLATVTPAAGYVGPMPALAIGALAGAVCYGATGGAARMARRVARFDDAFGVVAVHGVGGVLGMLLVGVFAHYSSDRSGLATADGQHLDGLVFGQAALLGHQVVGALAVCAFSAIVTLALAGVIRATIGLRATDEQQSVGLNAAFDLDNDAMPSGGTADRPHSVRDAATSSPLVATDRHRRRSVRISE